MSLFEWNCVYLRSYERSHHQVVGEESLPSFLCYCQSQQCSSCERFSIKYIVVKANYDLLALKPIHRIEIFSRLIRCHRGLLDCCFQPFSKAILSLDRLPPALLFRSTWKQLNTYLGTPLKPSHLTLKLHSEYLNLSQFHVSS